jgi:hypothetical protein
LDFDRELLDENQGIVDGFQNARFEPREEDPQEVSGRRLTPFLYPIWTRALFHPQIIGDLGAEDPFARGNKGIFDLSLSWQ